jgi:hypothetical protein
MQRICQNKVFKRINNVVGEQRFKWMYDNQFGDEEYWYGEIGGSQGTMEQ